MKLSGNGVNYKGRGLGNGNFQLKATVELYRPNLPELPTKVISARFGWYWSFLKQTLFTDIPSKLNRPIVSMPLAFLWMHHLSLRYLRQFSKLTEIRGCTKKMTEFSTTLLEMPRMACCGSNELSWSPHSIGYNICCWGVDDSLGFGGHSSFTVLDISVLHSFLLAVMGLRISLNAKSVRTFVLEIDRTFSRFASNNYLRITLS